MKKYVLRKIVLMALVLLFILIVSFSLIYITPGDPAEIILTSSSEGADPAAVEEFRIKEGFDEPLYVQYLNWLGAVEEVFSNPQHPYTRQLLQDKIQGRAGKEIIWPDFEANVEANVEAKTGITNGFDGCVFYAECPYADPECKAGNPEMLQNRTRALRPV